MSVPMVSLLNAGSLLHALGPWVLVGIAVMIFIESGLLFPFLPGDSLLVTAAILASSLGTSVWEIAPVAAVAAILGDQAGYWLGRRYGRRLFRPNAKVLTTERLVEAERFFARYGPLSLVLGRFVPVIRTYVPLAAGTARLPAGKFIRWNMIGALGWVIVMTAIGALLGGIPFIAKNIDALSVVIVVVSVAPIVIGALRKRRADRRAAQVEARVTAAFAAREQSSDAAADGPGSLDRTGADRDPLRS